MSHVYGADTPFEHVALDNVSLTVGRGEFVGLIGHTGSGKSTLIQHMNGLLKPSNGQVLFEGQDVWSDAKLTRRLRFHVGLVFQYPEYQLFEETVFQDIAFGPKNMGLSEDEVRARVLRAAGFVGITDKELEKSPFDLSGGQKRRAAIAGVIAMEPDVLILDEPTAGLDPVGRESILENIRAYQAAQGASVIMVSHSMEEIASNVDRLLVMNDSHLVMDATPAEVFAKPEELVQFWIFKITKQGIENAVFMVLRITLLVAGTFMLTYTTSPIALTDGLESLLSPLKKIGAPVHELAMMMCIALRFIPTLIEETDKIMSAQKARGADFESGNILARAKALIPILVPLFISAFRRADELATAMECRCYHGGEGRTKLHALHYAGRDYTAYCLGTLMLAGVIVLRHFGL